MIQKVNGSNPFEVGPSNAMAVSVNIGGIYADNRTGRKPVV